MNHKHCFADEAAELAAQIATITQDHSLRDPENFVAREAARNMITSRIIAGLDRLLAGLQNEEEQHLHSLKPDALQARAFLDQANEQLFTTYRDRIRKGALPPAAFRALLDSYAVPDEPEEWSDPPRYDHLDTFLDGLLQIATVPEARCEPEVEMVPYQATPVRVVLDMVERLALAPDDVVYDLGSGLGRVVIAVALASASQVTGVEYEPAYVAYARRCALELNLPRVSFVHADARDVDYAGGTVFFLYTPFKGTILRRVLSRLRYQARTRPIRLCTYGPGTLDVQDQDWLTSADDPELDIHHVTIFESTRERRTSAVRRLWRRS